MREATIVTSGHFIYIVAARGFAVRNCVSQAYTKRKKSMHMWAIALCSIVRNTHRVLWYVAIRL